MKELINKCLACSIEINEHNTVYETVEQYLSNLNNINYIFEDIDKDILNEMYKRDTIVTIHCYPRTAVSHYSVYHYDYDLAIQEMLNLLENER